MPNPRLDGAAIERSASTGSKSVGNCANFGGVAGLGTRSMQLDVLCVGRVETSRPVRVCYQHLLGFRARQGYARSLVVDLFVSVASKTHWYFIYVPCHLS